MLNFHDFCTMYKYVLNSVVKISMILPSISNRPTTILYLGGPFFCGHAVFTQEVFLPFYSARNARIASDVLATAIPSVRPSVTRRYCVKTAARSTVQFAPLDSKICLVL